MDGSLHLDSVYLKLVQEIFMCAVSHDVSEISFLCSHRVLILNKFVYTQNISNFCSPPKLFNAK